MSFQNMAILSDVTRCIGCELCVKACQEANRLPPEKPWRWVKRITDLSSARWTTIRRLEQEGGDRFLRRQCRHCLEPACVEACIVGAMKKTAEGPVVYDRDICIGCRYCMIACPWEIPRYSWEDTVPYVQKCDLCYQRVRKGHEPACTAACPNEATIFGERKQLIAEARRRLATRPDRYIQKIWGEHEVGGTSVLYISDVDIHLTDLDKEISDPTPMPRRTFKVLRHMPAAFLGMAAIMGGVWWIVERRQKLMGSNAGASPDQDESQSDPEERQS
jgi:formate dehydrogenase iron-sulfur subunit